MADVAESYLDENIKGTINTVPHDFNYLQRQVTRDVGTCYDPESRVHIIYYLILGRF